MRQSLKTLQPVDELKKGPFMLQVQVLGYQQTDVGVEVDISLSATSRSGCPVWESVLTLLSKNKLHTSSRCLSKIALKSEQFYGDPCFLCYDRKQWQPCIYLVIITYIRFFVF